MMFVYYTTPTTSAKQNSCGLRKEFRQVISEHLLRLKVLINGVA